MTIPAYPLAWPDGWKRSTSQRTATFGTNKTNSGKRRLTVAEAVTRVRAALATMGIPDFDLVVSTNLKLRLDGWPRSDQAEPGDSGAAVYWRDGRQDGWPRRCMAIDQYDRVADNLAAIAATLDAMRAIERHGGAAILDRAFTGFVALESPDADWARVFAIPTTSTENEVRDRYRYLRSLHHPDNGGLAEKFDQVQKAWTAYCRANGIKE